MLKSEEYFGPLERISPRFNSSEVNRTIEKKKKNN